MQKHKVIKKLTIAFFVVMLFFTLVSKSINYFTVPKVLLEKAVEGYLEDSITYFDGIEPYYTDCQELSLKQVLDRPISIENIYVGNNDAVKKGDPVISFDIKEYQRDITVLENKVNELNIEYKDFNMKSKTHVKELDKEIVQNADRLKHLEAQNYSLEADLYALDEQIRQLKKDYGSYAKKLKQNESLYTEGVIPLSELTEYKNKQASAQEQLTNLSNRLTAASKQKISEYKQKLEKAQESLKYINETGIYNGETSDSLLGQIKKAEKDLDKLKLLEKNKTIFSEQDGIIQALNTSVFSSYNGISPIGYIAAKDQEPCIKVKIGRDDLNRIKKGTDSQIIVQNIKVRGKVLKFLTEGQNQYMVIQPKDKASILSDSSRQISVIVNTKGELHEKLIPASALIDATHVYVAQEKNGFFGKEYCLKKTEVQILGCNEKYVSIGNGLQTSNFVVAAWDRELMDGAAVKTPLKQEVKP